MDELNMNKEPQSPGDSITQREKEGDALKLKIREYILKQTEKTEDDLNKDLEEFGISSVQFISFVIMIEQEFEIEFDTEYLDYNKFPDIQSIILYIKEKLLNAQAE